MLSFAKTFLTLCASVGTIVSLAVFPHIHQTLYTFSGLQHQELKSHLVVPTSASVYPGTLLHEHVLHAKA